MNLPDHSQTEFTTQPDCPEQSELADFLAGALAEDRLDWIADHAELCPACEEIIDGLERQPDAFLNNLLEPVAADAHDDRLSAMLLNAELITPTGHDTALPAAGDTSEFQITEEPDPLPETIGPYRVEHKIGQGGMAVVYRAWHSKLQRAVAVKTLIGTRLAATESSERFQREMAVAGQLDHPNIVRTLDADEVDGIPFLVMELVSGTDLTSIVKESGPMKLSDAVDCVIQAARGLEYAHQQGVIHRDIKPSNILRQSDGTIRIVDFGLSRLSEHQNTGAVVDSANLTMTGFVMGTVDFMAPEQALDSRVADERSDIYSLGCTLHFLITGMHLHSGETILARILAHRDQNPPSLRSMSSQLDTVFQKLVARDQSKRFQTMTEVIEALESLAAGRPLKSRRQWLRHPAMWAALMCVAFVTALPAILSLARSTERSKQINDTSDLKASSSHTFVLDHEPPDTIGNDDSQSDSVIPIDVPQTPPDGNEQHILTRYPTSETWSIAYSPDGQQVAIGCRSGVIRIHSAETDELLAILVGHTDGVRCVDWSSTTNRLASAGWDGTVRVWEQTGADWIRNPPVLTGPGIWESVDWNADGATLVVAGYDGRVLTVDSLTAQQSTICVHSDTVYSARWSPDGNQIASAGRDGTIRIWNRSAEALVLEHGHEGPVYDLAWNHDGNRLVTGGWDGSIRTRDVDGGKESILSQNMPRIYSVDWSHTDDQIAAIGLSGQLQIVGSDGASAPNIVDLQANAEEIAWNSQGTELGVALTGYQSAAYLSGQGEILRQKEHAYCGISRICVDGNRVLIACDDGQILDVSLESQTHTTDSAPFRVLAWQPRTERFVGVKSDGTTVLKDSPHSELKVLSGHKSSVVGACWNDTGSRLATYDAAGEVRIWTSEGDLIRVAHQSNGELATALAWRPQSDRLLVALGEGTLVEINSESGELTSQAELPGPINHIEWSPNGDWLAAASRSRIVHLLDAELDSGPSLTGHFRGPIATLAWSPDSQWIATGGFDRTVRFWTSDGNPGLVLETGSIVDDVAWDSSCEQLLIATHDDRVTRCHVDGTVHWTAFVLPEGVVVTGPDGNLLSGNTEALAKLARVSVTDDGVLKLTEVSPLAEPAPPPKPSKPPSTIEPGMDSEKVARLQKEWAEHLVLPVSQENSLGMPMILIPPGRFQMGSGPEERASVLEAERSRIDWMKMHVAYEAKEVETEITESFQISASEVTIAQFRKFVEATGYRTEAEERGGWLYLNGKSVNDSRLNWKTRFSEDFVSGYGDGPFDDYPVGCLTADDAQKFCDWLSDISGDIYELPTEAEWEYVCRAGTKTPWYWGSDPDDISRFEHNDRRIHPVCELQANPFGIYDLTGNAAEWCLDIFKPFGSKSKTDLNISDEQRMYRGVQGSAAVMRSAFRSWGNPNRAYSHYGFRPVRRLP